MLEQRQVTNMFGSLARFVGAGRSSVASMPMVAVIAVAVSTLHGVGAKADANRSVLSGAGSDVAFAVPAQSGAAALAQGAPASAGGARASALAEIERHMARARHAAASREPSSGGGAQRALASTGTAVPGQPAVERERLARQAATAREAEAARPPLKLTDEQRNIARFIASKYRVAVDDVQTFVAHAYRAAREFRLDPHLILAVVSVESSFNPNARSSKGAQGLMQVLTRVHTDKFAPFGGAAAAFDPVANITVGSAILKEYLVREGSVEGALKSYVGAALLSHDFGYGRKVLSERERIAAAAQGRAQAERQAGARVIPEAARITPDSGTPGETKTISLFDLDAPIGKIDVPPASSADLRGVEAVAQLMDKLHDH
ncbi:lytic transglycosylase domain-containing protein [Zeimonas arvi]|uniref:Lytic transglycosylase domain-containing protein n=1 Tax=Zeimonas arvi TaxID=2498847 RepID=A0A5C8P4Q1_9BURK|nr:lytic transglycosylase domain-containing protein [Zeimonas arvi]TXL68459.1 lytic transglycosylase domain-containing protein [Zeimonas arvi]